MRHFTSVVAFVSLALFAISSVSATGSGDLQGSSEQKRDVNAAPVKRETDAEYCEACKMAPDPECIPFCASLEY
ncbi:hypothetical protein INT45_004662 [Circinella minor]|uniref:Uncharacterized protein n=1 Tax=Circinella minor TaxID=1195481 RepID=A0A8H7VAW7_9FUNG|nr:hypothetical protein INT45_004662 [Circinella minor]